MLVDRMYLVFKKKFWSNIDDNINVEVNDRSPDDGGLHGDFSDALTHVKWTKKQKASGVGKLRHLYDSLGGWKHCRVSEISSFSFNPFNCIGQSKMVWR